MATTTTTAVEMTINLTVGPPAHGRPSRLAVWLTLALATDVVATCLFTLLDPDLLGGPAAMRGSAIGTALVVLTAAVPLLLGSVVAARRGSALAQLTWLGALAMIAYNALIGGAQ